MTVSRLLSQP